jgi:hypothetical protein
MGNISDVTRLLWANYSSSTQQLLEHIAETDGEDAALQIATAIQQECDLLRYGVYDPRITALTRQLNDALVVVRLQEKEILGRKGSTARDLRAKIVELEQRCADLQTALDHKPLDEAEERASLAEEVMLLGERIHYAALFCDDNNDRFVDSGVDAYLAFAFAPTTSLEKLSMAIAAAHLLLQAQAGRQKLAKMQI